MKSLRLRETFRMGLRALRCFAMGLGDLSAASSGWRIIWTGMAIWAKIAIASDGKAYFSSRFVKTAEHEQETSVRQLSVSDDVWQREGRWAFGEFARSCI